MLQPTFQKDLFSHTLKEGICITIFLSSLCIKLLLLIAFIFQELCLTIGSLVYLPFDFTTTVYKVVSYLRHQYPGFTSHQFLSLQVYCLYRLNGILAQIRCSCQVSWYKSILFLAGIISTLANQFSFEPSYRIAYLDELNILQK